MGGKVARGGAWSAVGEAARFVASLIATRYVTRILGPEGYGVWSLVTRVGSSLSFADAGVGVASTKFVSQAFARGDREGERRALWAALVIGLVPSLLCALLVLWLAPWAVHRFFAKVQPQFQGPMAVGLQIAAFGFALRTITAVFNSPLLARLRLDINALIFHGGIVLQLLLTPVALYYGGIVWGAAVSAIGWAIMGGVYLFVTSRLLPGAWKPVLDRDMLRRIARMGVGTFLMALAAQVLAVADLIIVGRFSVEAAGYYNLAYAASSLLTILPSALSQPLLPAFNRLLERDHDELQELVRNTMRAICLALPPVLAGMCALARPFFAWQGGDVYVANSTPVFLILLVGLALNFLSIVPLTLLLALGRTGATARVSLFEVIPFVLYTHALTAYFGTLGAASGRSLRFAIASAILFPLAARYSKMSFSPSLKIAPFALALCGTAAPIALAVWPRVPTWAAFLVTLGGVGFYAWIVRAQVLEEPERALLARLWERARALLRRS